MEVKNNWKGFYEARINSGYQDYFNQRYAPMINIIKHMKPGFVKEEGIGIGSISKSLKDTDIICFGFDNSFDMLALCQKNNPKIQVYDDCILDPKVKFDRDECLNQVIVTHGVLEHFSDEQIKEISYRQRLCKPLGIVHYVPLDKYKEPSFGDERLLPYQHWLNLIKPKDYVLFNDDHDLLLIF